MSAKTFTDTPAEASRLQALDAKADGLPLPGVLVGFGPRKAIGGGPRDGDWFGWTRWRYVTDETGKTYPVDEQLESVAKASSVLSPAEQLEVKTLVARATPAAGSELALET